LFVRVLMLAAPGAGKGTQGGLIAEHFGVPHVATGDLLRAHVAGETDLGRQVKGFLDKGELVPDGIVLDMVRGRCRQRRTTPGVTSEPSPVWWRVRSHGRVVECPASTEEVPERAA